MRVLCLILIITTFPFVISCQSELEKLSVSAEKAFKKKDYKLSISYLDQAIKLDSENSSYYEKRADAKKELKDEYGAKLDYSKAIILDNNNSNLYMKRGDLSYSSRSKNCIAALSDFNKAIELNPKLYYAYFLRGAMSGCRIDIESRIEDLNFYIENTKTPVSYAFYARGYLYSRLFKNKEALRDFNKAIKLDNKKSLYYWERGKFKIIRIKDIKSGCKDVKKADQLLFGKKRSDFYKKYCDSK